MGKLQAAVTGVFGWVPEDKLTNHDLEKLVDTNDEWIRSRTGIEERRILRTPGWATSDMCAEAVKGLLEKTGTKPGEIDLLIVATDGISDRVQTAFYEQLGIWQREGHSADDIAKQVIELATAMPEVFDDNATVAILLTPAGGT